MRYWSAADFLSPLFCRVLPSPFQRLVCPQAGRVADLTAWLTFIYRATGLRAVGVLGGGLTASRGAARSLGLPPPRPLYLDYSTGFVLCQDFFYRRTPPLAFRLAPCFTSHCRVLSGLTSLSWASAFPVRCLALPAAGILVSWRIPCAPAGQASSGSRGFPLDCLYYNSCLRFCQAFF